MDIFAVTCLAILILGGQHIINWLWRCETKDQDSVGFTLIVTLIILALTYWGFVLIIDWGSQIN